jgi:2-dehydro-3-deoxyglucarate aldolase
MKHQFRQRLSAGDLLLGTMVSVGSPELVEVLVTSGFDWLFFDGEHGPFGPVEMQAMLQAAGSEMPCLVRVPAHDQVYIKKALDIGAAGMVVPPVNPAAAAAAAVGRAKYPPMGRRGVGIARAHGYGLRFQEYMESANDEVAVVVQAEHHEAVANIEEIVRVPGVDAVLIGPYDLSASLGIPGQINDPVVSGAIDRVTEACQSARVPLGIFGVSAEAVRPYLERGYSLIIAGVDTVMLGRAAGEMIAELRADRSRLVSG